LQQHNVFATEMKPPDQSPFFLLPHAESSRQLMPDLHQMFQPGAAANSCCDHHQEHHHSHNHHADHNSHPRPPAVDKQQFTEHQAAQVVQLNAFGDDWEDLAAAAVRGAAVPHSHVGIWPQFSMANHSCLPNTVHYVVGHALVVRAVEDISAGEMLQQTSEAATLPRLSSMADG
jgi:hypothetical protein